MSQILLSAAVVIGALRVNLYTALKSMRIDKSLMYLSHPEDRINTQVIYRLQAPVNFVNKHGITVTLSWQECSIYDSCRSLIA